MAAVAAVASSSGGGPGVRLGLAGAGLARRLRRGRPVRRGAGQLRLGSGCGSVAFFSTLANDAESWSLGWSCTTRSNWAAASAAWPWTM